MRRLRVRMLVFCLALSIPLGYFLLRTFRSLAQEEEDELRYFAGTLFDEIGRDLAALVREEEGRPVDAYTESVPDASAPAYVLGYLQNNPDGSLHVPAWGPAEDRPPANREELERINALFNRQRTSLPRSPELPAPEAEAAPKEKLAGKQSLADRYLDLSSRPREGKSFLGRRESRVDRITQEQALNLQVQPLPGDVPGTWALEEREADAGSGRGRDFSVEVDPLQSVVVDPDHILVFRRLVLRNQVFRQGFVIRVNDFLNALAGAYFSGQPMARFTRLELSVREPGRTLTALAAGAPAGGEPRFSLARAFPRPFDFLHGTLTCERIPPSPGRRVLLFMTVLLGAVMFVGLFAIYRGSRAVLELSRRRAGFVSAVTHELKTPLANIRMYIEMLEQGMARDPEREQDYYAVLGAESARLSRLIDNVLEFSRLENRQRVPDMREGALEDVVREVRGILGPKLEAEGFRLREDLRLAGPFRHDRELMIQVLINLIENSMKFGRGAPVREIALRAAREGGRVKVSVSDTGPGIPRRALRRIFQDFYRVDDSLTRATGGTGIGLALVKRCVEAMGGSVTAANNSGPGCTFTLTLPG